MASSITKCACGCIVLHYSPSVAKIVLIVLSSEVVLIVEIVLGVKTILGISIVEIVLAVSIRLLVLTVLTVPVVGYHLSASTFCYVMASSLAKGAEPAPVGWW